MRAVMLSIRPEWCEKIASRKKTIEVRKNRPNLETPFKCYIYCTSGPGFLNWVNGVLVWIQKDFLEGRLGLHIRLNKKVIGEFTCNDIEVIDVPYPAFRGRMNQRIIDCSCLDYWSLHHYAYSDCLYGWHISNLKIYDRPKELKSFLKGGALSYDDWLYGIYNGHGGARSSYASYLNAFHMSRPPQSWCYVEELGGNVGNVMVNRTMAVMTREQHEQLHTIK